MAKAKYESVIPAESIKLYDRLIERVPGIKRKGVVMPYTSLNGHMFSFLTTEGLLALRLPKDIREEFLRRYNARPCEANGTVLKEYITVPPEILQQKNLLLGYFKEAYSYVSSLKPRPSRK